MRLKTTHLQTAGLLANTRKCVDDIAYQYQGLFVERLEF